MYKIIIVDDEKEIRQGLSEFIDWYELGFDLVASFEDGKEAIEYLEKNDVDIILTDILMAEVSGLELAEYVHINKPRIKVVIISGYKEFEYAKKAMEFNVDNYLLKPTDIDQTVKVFLEIKKKLDKERDDQTRQREIQKKYQEMVPMLEEQFFLDLLAGGLGGKSQIMRKMSAIDLDIEPDTSRCMIVYVDLPAINSNVNKEWIHGKERLHIALRNSFRFSRDGMRYFPVFADDCLKVIVITLENSDCQEMSFKVDRHLEEVIETIRKILGLKITIAEKRYFSSLIELSKYREHFKITGEDTVEDANYSLEPEIYHHLVQKCKLFVSNIVEGDLEALSNLGESYMAEISGLPLRLIQRLVSDLFTILFNKLYEMGFKFDSTIFRKTDYLNIAQIDNAEAVKVLLIEGLTSLAGYMASQRMNSLETSISRAVQYVENNYSRDISLDDVSNEVFLSPVYFSRLFKQQTGDNFTDYLTRVRMEKAIQLIGLGKYKTYEISSMVGYNSSKYFSKVFKLYTGYAPKDYARSIGRGDPANDK